MFSNSFTAQTGSTVFKLVTMNRIASRTATRGLKDANGLCELNDCGFEDLCNRDKFLTYSKGFVFQQIKTIIKKVSNMIDKTKLVPCQVIKGI